MTRELTFAVMSISGAPQSASITTPDDFPAQYDPRATESAITSAGSNPAVSLRDASRSRRVGGDRDPYGILMPRRTSRPFCTSDMAEQHRARRVARWARMKGLETLWLPGTDHAGSDANVVEKHSPPKVSLARSGREKSSSAEDLRRGNRRRHSAATARYRRVGRLEPHGVHFSPEAEAAVREAFVACSNAD